MQARSNNRHSPLIFHPLGARAEMLLWLSFRNRGRKISIITLCRHHTASEPQSSKTKGLRLYNNFWVLWRKEGVFDQENSIACAFLFYLMSAQDQGATQLHSLVQLIYRSGLHCYAIIFNSLKWLGLLRRKGRSRAGGMPSIEPFGAFLKKIGPEEKCPIIEMTSPIYWNDLAKS